MKKAAFEKVHGKLAPNVVYIDLDDQPKAPPEVVTAGWTDTQLRAKSLPELDAMIASGEMALTNLRNIVDTEVERIEGLKKARSRKLLL